MSKTEFDYSKLRGRIVEKYGTQIEFAKAMNWSERTLTLHMRNKRDWKQADIMRVVELLDLSVIDICPYFFRPKVQKNEQFRMLP